MSFPIRKKVFFIILSTIFYRNHTFYPCIELNMLTVKNPCCRRFFIFHTICSKLTDFLAEKYSFIFRIYMHLVTTVSNQEMSLIPSLAAKLG